MTNSNKIEIIIFFKNTVKLALKLILLHTMTTKRSFNNILCN